jgi:hypothetical protein
MKLRKIFFWTIAIFFTISCETFDELAIEPEVQNVSAESAALIEDFATLTGGNTSACYLVYETEEIPNTLCRIVSEAEEGSEIVFLVDKTGSMEDDIDEVKRNINEIIECLPDGCRLGAAAYGDNRVDGDNWYNSSDLNADYSVAREFINAISVFGGGDSVPESVYDAIYKALDEMSWQDCSAPDKIIVMGDAPPLTGGATDYDADDVLAKARSLCDNTEFYPVIVLDL